MERKKKHSSFDQEDLVLGYVTGYTGIPHVTSLLSVFKRHLKTE